MPSSLDRPLRAIDLFCGAGGLTKGSVTLVRRTVRPRLRCRFCRDLSSQPPRNHVELASIVDFDPARITQIVTVPSTSSSAGRAVSRSVPPPEVWMVSEDDERNDLWEHIFGIVEHVRPRAFLMENVPGMVLWRDGAFGDKILKRFPQHRYKVTKDILLAADWGVPQRRRRLFIVGVRDGRCFRLPPSRLISAVGASRHTRTVGDTPARAWAPGARHRRRRSVGTAERS